jgi:hypothetical protein
VALPLTMETVQQRGVGTCTSSHHHRMHCVLLAKTIGAGTPCCVLEPLHQAGCTTSATHTDATTFVSDAH